MSQKLGTRLCRTIAYASYILSGCFIFSPLHKAQNILIAIISAFLSGFILLWITKSVFDRKASSSCGKAVLYKAASLFAIIFSCTATLMLLTEIIKDTAYIASRGISLFYYIAISVAILGVSFSLCLNSQKGIYRFCILSAIIFILLNILIPTAFITTKSAVFDASGLGIHSYKSSFLYGVLSGIYFTCDTSIFLFCFGDFFITENKKTDTRSLLTGYIISFGFILFYHLTAVLIFGSNLLRMLNDPDYALVKLISGTDLTEIISAVRIFSFMIKSSVYLFSSASALKAYQRKKGTSPFRIIIFEYALIPASVVALCLFDRSLGYGEFQFLIYPITILLSAIFMLLQKAEKPR